MFAFSSTCCSYCTYSFLFNNFVDVCTQFLMAVLYALVHMYVCVYFMKTTARALCAVIPHLCTRSLLSQSRSLKTCLICTQAKFITANLPFNTKQVHYNEWRTVTFRFNEFAIERCKLFLVGWSVRYKCYAHGADSFRNFLNKT